MSNHIKSNITLNDNLLFNNIRYSHLRQWIRVLPAKLGEFSLSCWMRISIYVYKCMCIWTNKDILDYWHGLCWGGPGRGLGRGM